MRPSCLESLRYNPHLAGCPDVLRWDVDPQAAPARGAGGGDEWVGG